MQNEKACYFLCDFAVFYPSNGLLMILDSKFHDFLKNPRFKKSIWAYYLLSKLSFFGPGASKAATFAQTL